MIRLLSIIFIILGLVTLTIEAQIVSPIITFKQNDTWIDSLEKSSLDIQIAMIKSRLINDTAVYSPSMIVPVGVLRDKTIYVPQNYVKNLTLSDLANDTFKINGLKGDSRLLFACRLKNNSNKYDFISIKRDNTTKISTIIKISKIISKSNISRIEIIKNSDDKFVLFGASFGFGVIIMDFSNKKDYKLIKRLNN